jgi:diguanylate cyclase (GGDEF)-like protein/PAS domain S-box-containing protein
VLDARCAERQYLREIDSAERRNTRVPSNAAGSLEQAGPDRPKDVEPKLHDVGSGIAFDKAPIGIAVLALENGFRIIAANSTLAGMLGYTEAELIALPPRALTHPDDREPEIERFYEFAAGGADSYELEKRYVRRDGTVFRALLRAHAERDEERRIRRLIVFVEDVEARRSTEETFRAAAESGFGSFSLFRAVREGGDITGFVLEYANRRAVRGLGMALEDAVGRSLDEVSAESVRDRLRHEFALVIETQKPIEGELTLPGKGGDDAFVLYQAVPAGDGIAFTARDVTAQRRAIDALRFEEERLETIVGHAHDAIFVVDHEWCTRWVSPAITAIAGYKPEALRGTRLVDLVHELDRDQFEQHRTYTRLHPGQTHQTEVRFRHADGNWIWAQMLARNLYDHPAVNGLVEHVRDITEKKVAEDALRASEQRFRALVQNAYDLVSVYDDDFKPVYLSPSHEMVLGYRAAELRAQSLSIPIHPADAARFGHVLELVAGQPQRTAACQYRVRHADGSWRQFEAHFSNLLDEPAVRGIVVNARDVTEASAAVEALREREEWFRSLVQRSWDLLAVLDRNGRITYLSPSHINALGRSLETIATAGDELLHPDDIERVVQAFRDAVERPDVPVHVQYRMLHADNTWRYFDTTYTNLLNEPTVAGVVMNAREVTEAVEAINALRASEERFATLVRYSSDVVLVTQSDDVIRYVSPAVDYVLGYTEAEFLEHPLASYVHPDDREGWDTHLAEVLDYPGREHTLELRLRHADGRWRWMEAHAVNLLEDPSLKGVVLHLHDISERRVAETELEHQALHDPLTGLPNRALVLDRLGRGLARNARSHMYTAVLFIDVDRFKSVNDSLGHASGDDLLVSVAARLRASLRESDTVARLGGDEFVVLLEDVQQQAVALEVGDKILDAMRRPFQLFGRELFVTASIGLAVSTGDHDTPESMVRDADAAMYVAKGRGRNRLELFDEAIRIRAVNHLEVENDLHRALDRGELRLDYQPAFHLETDTIVDVEALLRWDHPRNGLMPPADFIGVAEETGVIVDIGHWIIDEACRQVRAWRDEGSSLRTLWVNLSARQLAGNDLPDIIDDALVRHGLPHDALGLELTESALIEEAEGAGNMLRALEEIGVRLAIDDFGTGYSSLLYLQRYHVDVLKVDRSFVNGLGTSADDTAITSAVISLGHNLGMEVSAEGVETPTQLAHLRDLRCDTACGYYLVRPTTPDAVTELLRAST